MHGFSVLPRGLPLSLAAGAALGALSRRPLARPGHRLLLFCLTASRVPVRRPLRRCRHPSHVCCRTAGRAVGTTRRRGLWHARATRHAAYVHRRQPDVATAAEATVAIVVVVVVVVVRYARVKSSQKKKFCNNEVCP